MGSVAKVFQGPNIKIQKWSCMPAQNYVLGVYCLRIHVLDEMTVCLQAYIHTPKSW